MVQIWINSDNVMCTEKEKVFSKKFLFSSSDDSKWDLKFLVQGRK